MNDSANWDSKSIEINSNYESSQPKIINTIQEINQKLSQESHTTYSLLNVDITQEMKVAKLIAKLTQTDEFRHIMDKSLYEDFFSYEEDKDKFEDGAVFRCEIYDTILIDPIYVFMFLQNFPEFNLPLLEHIHFNKLLITDAVYMSIFDSFFNSTVSHDMEQFNSLMSVMFPYLPHTVAICLLVEGKIPKYDGLEQHVVNLINKLDDNCLAKLLETDGIVEYMNLLMFNINSFVLLKYFTKYLTDDFICENINKFNLDALKFIIGLQLENDTIYKIRDRMIELDYFNPDNFRMLTKETKINYLKQYYQIEGDTIIGYTGIYDNRIILAMGNNVLKNVEDDCFKGIYNHYDSKLFDATYHKNNEHAINETFVLLNVKDAYNYIKDKKCTIVEILVDINDIHFAKKEEKFIAQCGEVNEFPMASQLSTLISDKYGNIDNYPNYVPIEVNPTEELFKLKKKSDIDTGLTYDDYDISSLTEHLSVFIKLFNVSDSSKFDVFTSYANLLMSNSKFLLEYPSHLKLFIDKCNELRYHYPILDKYIDKIKSDLPIYLDKDVKYRKSPILADIFGFEVENSDDEEVLIEDIEYDNIKSDDIEFVISDTPGETMSHEMINNFIQDIKNIVEEKDINTGLLLLKNICNKYLMDGGLWKENDSILSHVLPLLNKYVDKDPFIIDYIDIIQKYRQKSEIVKADVIPNEIIPDISDNLEISDDDLEMNPVIPVDEIFELNDMYSSDDEDIVPLPKKKTIKKITKAEKKFKKIKKVRKSSITYSQTEISSQSDIDYIDEISNFIDINMNIPKKKLTPKNKKQIHPKKRVKKPKKDYRNKF